MKVVLEIITSLPPDIVLERLRSRGREWRESTLPPGLRDAGVVAVRTSMRHGRTFRIWGVGGGRRTYYPVCVGEVTRVSGGGTRVRARIRPSAASVVGAALWLGWTAFVSYLSGSVGFLAFGVVASAAAFAFEKVRAAAWEQALLTIVSEATAAAPRPELLSADATVRRRMPFERFGASG